MASEVDICNIALNNLGASNITALDEDSKSGRLCNQRYEFVRDTVFRSSPWNCLIQRVELAQDADTPPFGFSYQYTLPANPYCLRVLTMWTAQTNADESAYDNGDIMFKIEGRKLLTNESTAKIIYLARVEDPNEYDSLLIEAIAARLSAELCYAVTGSAALLNPMIATYEAKLKEARFADASEGMPDRIMAESFIESRF
tara:strand:+ start:1471 stop:2070 length:600 start_codon:yes stop_codon:yes gene_type:complete